MRILLIKTSSMGDLIHTLPALTDAARAIPNIQFDWLVEDSFVEIPKWHPNVNQVIPVALRRWRKGIFSQATRTEWRTLREKLQNNHYDYILDAQGLVKSAFLTRLAKGKRIGLDWKSARESLASLFYEKKCKVNFYQHAIVRMRSLFSQALDYDLPNTPPEFALNRELLLDANQKEKYLVFLHGTTWTTKLWPEAYWIKLAKFANQAGLRVKISAGNQEELKRAERIAQQAVGVDVIPRLSLTNMAKLLANAHAAIAVDTGFGHLAAALETPTITIYGATNPVYTGALGKHSIHLSAQFPCAPCLSRKCKYKGPALTSPACYSSVSPEKVWRALTSLETPSRVPA